MNELPSPTLPDVTPATGNGGAGGSAIREQDPFLQRALGEAALLLGVPAAALPDALHVRDWSAPERALAGAIGGRLAEGRAPVRVERVGLARSVHDLSWVQLQVEVGGRLDRWRGREARQPVLLARHGVNDQLDPRPTLGLGRVVASGDDWYGLGRTALDRRSRQGVDHLLGWLAAGGHRAAVPDAGRVVTRGLQLAELRRDVLDWSDRWVVVLAQARDRRLDLHAMVRGKVRPVPAQWDWLEHATGALSALPVHPPVEEAIWRDLPGVAAVVARVLEALLDELVELIGRAARANEAASTAAALAADWNGSVADLLGLADLLEGPSSSRRTAA